MHTIICLERTHDKVVTVCVTDPQLIFSDGMLQHQIWNGRYSRSWNGKMWTAMSRQCSVVCSSLVTVLLFDVYVSSIK